MKRMLVLMAAVAALLGCGEEPAAKTGALPAQLTANYPAPDSREAKTSYIEGFRARYDIPVLEYPPEVQEAIEKARFKRFRRMKRLSAANTKVVRASLSAIGTESDVARFDAATRKSELVLKELTDGDIALMIKAMSPPPKRTPEQLQRHYERLVAAYPRRVRTLSVDRCQWTEMRRLVGSGHEALAYQYGEHPTHGYECIVKTKIAVYKGKVTRDDTFQAFFVRDSKGTLRYFGKFRDVGVKPRLMRLDPLAFENPDKYVRGDLARAFDS